MELNFLGVGEACDGNQPNTSILLKTDSSKTAGRILLDCGFSVPHQYLSLNPPTEELETLWISHFHGDHYCGLPLLLLRFWEMGRTKPLLLIGQNGIADKVYAIMDMAFSGFMKKLCYEIQFKEVESGRPESISGLSFQAVDQ